MAKGDKYINLKHHLEKSEEPEVKLSFEEIEKIVGLPLPVSATKHANEWWSNNYDHSQAIAWIDAGYKTISVTETCKNQVMESITFINRK